MQTQRCSTKYNSQPDGAAMFRISTALYQPQPWQIVLSSMSI